MTRENTESTSEKIFSLKCFSGMNENPDGDTKLEFGEAAVMRNFCVTRDGNLKKRPGTKLIKLLGSAPVAGLWCGELNGKRELLAACGGALFRLWDDENSCYIKQALGSVSTSKRVHIFGFGGKAYIMDGEHYLAYDGQTLSTVEGYRPLVAVTVPPTGGGELLERINKLTPARRARFSPDGTARTFSLPETGISAVDYVKKLSTGEVLNESAYTVNTSEGTLSFYEAPEEGVDTIEIGWTAAGSDRSAVEHMSFSELYNGTTDARVFIYGDGSNRAFYSGLDYDGRARADYFPELNELAIGDENTPITGMIRHFSRLIVYKSDSTWSVSYGNLTLNDGSVTPAFYALPVNRSIGNAAAGQMQLVLNSPRTLFGNDVYEWKSSSSYDATLTSDERQARRISDRIYATLKGFNAESCLCFDDNPRQEYFICCGDTALVHNYAVDAWYCYKGLAITAMVSFSGERLIGTNDGRILHMSEKYPYDCGESIDAYWESGSMSFGAEYMRKYSAQVWVGIKPEVHGEVYVSVQTDRHGNYAERLAASTMISFTNADFADWSFNVNRKPQMTRLKIKAKKFVFYKLIFMSDTADSTATILAADLRVRFTGYAK